MVTNSACMETLDISNDGLCNLVMKEAAYNSQSAFNKGMLDLCITLVGVRRNQGLIYHR